MHIHAHLQILQHIDKLYTQMGKVFRLTLELNLFAALFWALGIVLAHILQQVTQPAAWHHSTTVQYTVIKAFGGLVIFRAIAENITSYSREIYGQLKSLP